METETTDLSNNFIANMSNEDLRNKYTTLSKLYSQLQLDLEEKSQQMHNDKRELTRLNQLETEYLSEIELLQCGERNECEKLKLRIQNLEEEKNELACSYSNQIDCLENDIFKKDEEILKLEDDLKILTNISTSASNQVDEVNQLHSENNELQARLSELTNVVVILEEQIACFEQQKLVHEEEVNKLGIELEGLKESYNYKKEELNEAKVLTETLQEDLLFTKNELESAKSIPLQDGSQGNSLFAEVDDKRLELQERMAVMKTQYLEMKQERSKLLSQIAGLNCKNATLCQRWENESQERINDNDKIEESYRARLQLLESQLESCKKELSSRQEISAINLDSGEIQFMENMLESKNKEVEKLQKAVNGLSFARMVLCRQLRDANVEMRNWRAKATKLESDFGKLLAELGDLKLKNNDSEIVHECPSCLRRKQSIIPSQTNRPKLRNVVESLSRNSNKLMDGADRFATLDCSRQIKRSLLKDQDPNHTTSKDFENSACKKDKENAQPDREIHSLSTAVKKVQFSENTVDNSDTNREKLKKIGKVIHCKPIVLKKKS